MTVRSAEKVTLAIAGTARKPTVAAVREATALSAPSPGRASRTSRRPARSTSASPGSRSLALVKGLKFGKTSKAFRIPKSAGYYDQGGLKLALRRAAQTLNTATFQFVAGGA